jgi:hypothetical protein
MTLLTYTAVSPAPPHALITHAHSKHPGLHACASLCPCTKTGRRVSMWQRFPPISCSIFSPESLLSSCGRLKECCSLVRSGDNDLEPISLTAADWLGGPISK